MTICKAHHREKTAPEYRWKLLRSSALIFGAIFFAVSIFEFCLTAAVDPLKALLPLQEVLYERINRAPSRAWYSLNPTSRDKELRRCQKVAVRAMTTSCLNAYSTLAPEDEERLQKAADRYWR